VITFHLSSDHLEQRLKLLYAGAKRQNKIYGVDLDFDESFLHYLYHNIERLMSLLRNKNVFQYRGLSTKYLLIELTRRNRILKIILSYRAGL
jgi:hypothetical protein